MTTKNDLIRMLLCNVKMMYGVFIVCLLAINSLHAQYCTPKFTENADDCNIKSIITTGGTTNINNTNTGYGLNDSGYSDYTSIQHVTQVGNNLGFSMTQGAATYSTYFYIWIDKNNDDSFTGDDEQVYVSPSSASSHSGTILASKLPPPGTYRIRFMSNYYAVNNPCVEDQWGEAEDYTLVVTPPTTPCSGMPNAGIASINPPSVAVNTTYSVSAMEISYELGITYTWQQFDDNLNDWTDIGTGTSYYTSLSNQTAPGTVDIERKYRLKTHCADSDQTNFSSVASFITQHAYCTPVFSNSAEYIKEMTITGLTSIHNPSDGTSTTSPGYSNFSALKVSILPGSNVDFEYTLNYAGGHYGRVWIDANQNGVFDVNELFYDETTRKQTHQGTLDVSLLPIGSYRMRFLSFYNISDGTPCVSNGNWGEVEDYTLVVTLGDPCSGQPSASTIIATPYMVVVNSNVNVKTTSQVSYGPGTEYTWQKSTDNGTTWTAVGTPNATTFAQLNGETAPSTAGQETKYRLVVKCTNSNLLDTSNVVTITAIANDYCKPNLSTGSGSDSYYIREFHTSDAVSDIHNVTNVKSPNGYADFSASNIVTTVPGMTFTATVNLNSNSNQGVAIWVDWNKNGVFETNEVMAYSTGYIMSNMFSSEITVPTNQAQGMYLMRVLNLGYYSDLVSDLGGGFIVGPCVISPTSKRGEIEEYTIQVVELTPCSDPANAGVVSLNPNVGNPGSTFSVKSTGYPLNSGLSFLWEKSINGGGSWTVEYTGNTYQHLHNQVAPPLGDSIMYRLQVTCGVKATSNIATFKSELTYCVPSFPSSSTSDGPISNVTIKIAGLEVLNNSSTGLGTTSPGYSDYTNMSVTATTADILDISVTEVNSVGYPTYFWIDTNRNGFFEATELFHYVDNSGGGGLQQTVSTTIALSDFQPGIYRMRFVTYWSGNPNPCPNNSYGEAEDYTLIVQNGNDCSGQPSAATIAVNPTTANPGTLYDVTASGTFTEDGLTFQWEKSTNNGAWTPVGSLYTLYTALNGQVAPFDTSQVVQYRLIVSCGSESSTSNVAQFKSSLTYCIPKFTDPTDYISKVQTTEGTVNLNNTSGVGLNGYGYSDYTNQQIVVEAGKNIWFEMTAPTVTSYVGHVWIDDNNNGFFEPSESYYYNSGSNMNVHSDSLLIKTLPIGSYRIRFMIHWHNGDDPCIDSPMGEAEDYTLVIKNVVSCGGTPNAGTITLSQDTANPNDLFSVIATGADVDSGLSYTWEKSTDNGANWTVAANTTTYSNLNDQVAPPNIDDEVLYRLKVACGLDSATSNTVTFTTQWTYCIPIFSAQTDQLYISDVITTGGQTNLNNINTSYGLNGNGYSDYTAQTLKVVQGFNVDFEVKLVNYPESYGLVISIDANQNGTFELNEAIYNAPGGVPQQTHSGTLDIQALPVGIYRMRVLAVSGWTNSTCTVQTYGEAEDYTLEIVTATPCSGTIIAGNVNVSPTTASPLTAYNVTASGYSTQSGLSFIWEQSTDDIDTWTAVGTPTSYYVSLGQVASEELDAEVKYRLRVACGTDTVTSNVAIFTTQAIYCIPSYFHSDEYTTAFSTTINGTVNANYTATAQTGTNGYNDLTSDPLQVTSQQAGESFDFSHSYFLIDDYYSLNIWIDWNKNGTFENTELEYSNYSYSASTLTGTITVPMTATPGEYRMRIRSRNYYNTDIDPCTQEIYGQAIDLKIVVLPPPPCSGTPNVPTVSISPNVGNGGSSYEVTASGFSTNSGLTFTWKSSLNDGEWQTIGEPGNVYVPLTETASYTIGDVVKYRLQVSCDVTADTATSNIVNFTTHKVYCTPKHVWDNIYLSSFQTTNAQTNANYSANAQTGADGYDDLTNIATQKISQYIGQSFNFTSALSQGSGEVVIWIDWDNNGTFEESETVLPSGNFNGTISIPNTVQPGNYRMRVRSYLGTGAFTGPNGACVQVGFGQALDFTLEALECIANAGTIVEGNVSICQGKTIQLTATETNGTPTWTSDNENVASIDPSSGIVSGVAQGTVQITYSLTNANGCTAITTATLTVTDTSIVAFTATPKLSEQQDTLTVDDEFDYVATPNTGAWTSTDQTVAIFDPNSGHLTALSVGQTTIKYTDQATCGGSALRILVVVAKDEPPLPCPNPPCEGNNGIDEHDFVSNVSLFPNPANNEVQLTFTMHENSEIRIEIVDLNGKIMETVVFNNAVIGTNTITFNVENYANGVYSVILRSNDALTTQKLVVGK